MRAVLILCLTTSFLLLLSACSEEPRPQAKEPDWDKIIAKKLNQGNSAPTGELPVAASSGGVSLSLAPQNPASGACLTVSIKGKPADQVLTWEVNGISVQIGEERSYCLEGAQRDDVVTVTIGDERAGGSASVLVANSPPKIIDTQFLQVDEGGQTFIEVVPDIQDLDDDSLTIEYQWLLNGEPLEDQPGSRLPSTAFSKGDEIKVAIVVDDGYSRSARYETRNLNLPGGPPVITSRPPTSFQAAEYNYQVKASDPDGDPVTFTLDEAPEGMVIDAETGQISWPLKKVEPGAYRIRISVSDADGGNAYQEFTLTLAK